jgi:hypothetical protein
MAEKEKWVLNRNALDGWEWNKGFLKIRREILDESFVQLDGERVLNEIIWCYQLYRVKYIGDTPELLSHVWQFDDLTTAKRVGNILLTT